jgi:hypothetical protein
MKGEQKMTEINNCVFRLSEEKYPELKDASIIISEEGDQVYIGVKCMGRIYSVENGSITVRPMQFGDIGHVSKSATVEELFEVLNSTFKSVQQLIDQAKSGTVDDLMNGDKA